MCSKTDGCGKETILEDGGASSDLAEALIVTSGGLSIYEWRIS